MDKTNTTCPAAPLVLVVDDEPTMRYLMRRSLTLDGYRVEEAGDGLQALEVFEKTQPDLVLLDIMMPKLDGFAVCDQLLRLPHGKKAQVVMVTGVSDRHAIDQAFKVGAVDYITKPVHQRVLRQRVGFILRAQQSDTWSPVDQTYHQRLFANAPVALCTWDFSEALRLLELVQTTGPDDLNTCLVDRPDIIQACLASICLSEANQRAWALFQAKDEDPGQVRLDRLCPPESLVAWAGLLVALAGDQAQGEVALPMSLLTGEVVKVKLSWALTADEAPSSDQVSLAMAVLEAKPDPGPIIVSNGREKPTEIEFQLKA